MAEAYPIEVVRPVPAQGLRTAIYDIVENHETGTSQVRIYPDGTTLRRLSEPHTNRLHMSDVLGRPAIELPDGGVAHCFGGHLHSLTGPAIQRAAGTQEYYIVGVSVDKETWGRVANALRENKALTILYHMPEGGEPVAESIAPRLLLSEHVEMLRMALENGAIVRGDEAHREDIFCSRKFYDALRANKVTTAHESRLNNGMER